MFAEGETIDKITHGGISNKHPCCISFVACHFLVEYIHDDELVFEELLYGLFELCHFVDQCDILVDLVRTSQIFIEFPKLISLFFISI